MYQTESVTAVRNSLAPEGYNSCETFCLSHHSRTSKQFVYWSTEWWVPRVLWIVSFRNHPATYAIMHVVIKYYALSGKDDMNTSQVRGWLAPFHPRSDRIERNGMPSKLPTHYIAYRTWPVIRKPQYISSTHIPGWTAPQEWGNFSLCGSLYFFCSACLRASEG